MIKRRVLRVSVPFYLGGNVFMSKYPGTARAWEERRGEGEGERDDDAAHAVTDTISMS